jgi:hypothetical protein
MQVKLSYTTAVEDVLGEAANLLGGVGPTMQEAIDLYSAAIKSLNEEEFNPNIFFEKVEKFRKNLEKVHVRAVEVVQIVDGYGEYKKQERANASNINSEQSEEGAPSLTLREKFVGSPSDEETQEAVND